MALHPSPLPQPPPAVRLSSLIPTTATSPRPSKDEGGNSCSGSCCSGITFGLQSKSWLFSPQMDAVEMIQLCTETHLAEEEQGTARQTPECLQRLEQLQHRNSPCPCHQLSLILQLSVAAGKQQFQPPGRSRPHPVHGGFGVSLEPCHCPDPVPSPAALPQND